MSRPAEPSRADPRPVERDEPVADVGRGSAHQPGAGAAGPGSGTPGGAPAGEAGSLAGAVVDWLLVGFVTLLCALTAVVGIAYLPWHLGAVPMPVSALLGVGAMVLAPRACYRLTGSLAAAALPVLVWFGVTVWLVLTRNPMMRSQALSVVQGQWRVMVLLGLGSLAAAATLTLLWADRTQARYAGTAGANGAAAAAPGPVEADEPTGGSG